MNYCTKCGTKIEEGEKFCSQCGKAVEVYSAYNEEMNRPMPTGNEYQLARGTNHKSKEELAPLILGILSLLLDCCTCACFPLGFVVIIIAILGIVYGSKQSKETGSPEAKAGKTMSIIALILVWICIIVGFIMG